MKGILRREFAVKFAGALAALVVGLRPKTSEAQGVVQEPVRPLRPLPAPMMRPLTRTVTITIRAPRNVPVVPVIQRMDVVAPLKSIDERLVRPIVLDLTTRESLTWLRHQGPPPALLFS